MQSYERKNPGDYTGWGYVFLIDGLIKRINEFLMLGEYETAYNCLENLYSETINIITKKATDEKDDPIPKGFEEIVAYNIKKAKKGITQTDLVNLERTRNTLRTSTRIPVKILREYHNMMSMLTHKADLRFKEFKSGAEPITSG